MLPQNVGETDRAFRIVGGVLLLLYSVISLQGNTQLIAVIFSLGAIITGMLGMCGIYALLGMSTCPAPSKPKVKKSTKKVVSSKTALTPKRKTNKTKK